MTNDGQWVKSKASEIPPFVIPALRFVMFKQSKNLQYILDDYGNIQIQFTYLSNIFTNLVVSFTSSLSRRIDRAFPTDSLST